jgi:hypothetical protein
MRLRQIRERDPAEFELDWLQMQAEAAERRADLWAAEAELNEWRLLSLSIRNDIQALTEARCEHR